MAQTPLKVSVPLKGELLIRFEGSEELHSIGMVTYTADVEVALMQPQSNNILFEGQR